MSSTITLQNTIDWARPFLQFRPLNIGTGNEPAMSIANLVKQTILGPPFRWIWNRADLSSFNTVAGTQDYTQTISDFGFIEKASLTESGKTFEIANIRMILSRGSEQSKPESIAPLLDNNAGSITLRFLNVPDKAYTVNILYQRKATLFTLLSNTWTPIPDELSFVYNQGFLAFSAMYADDLRWQIEMQRFLASLIGVSQGLDETQKNQFIESWLISLGQSAAYQQKVPLGVISRGSLK